MVKAGQQALNYAHSIPEGISVNIQGYDVTVGKGDKKVTKRMATKVLSYSVKDNAVLFEAPKTTRTAHKLMKSYMAHLNWMFKGVTDGHVYKMKICSGHFPMNVSLSGTKFTIKNFLGEAKPRVVSLPEGVKVQVKGNDVEIASPDKELAGNTATMIERLTKIKGRDCRIFQDGIFIVQKSK